MRHSLTRWTAWGRARSVLLPGCRGGSLPNVRSPHSGGDPAWHGPSLAVITCMQNAPKRRRGWQRMGWFDSIIDSMDMNLSKLQETVRDRGAWRAVVHAAESDTTKCLINKSIPRPQRP